MKVIATNKKASHDYFILSKMECGVVLKGTEIKAIRAGKVNLKDSYARIKDGEMFAVNVHISKYDYGNRFNHDETRERKLLLHKKEIEKLGKQIQLERLTLIPIKLYLLKGRAKIEVAVCKGKKLHDKRQSLKEKDMQRRTEKILKNY